MLSKCRHFCPVRAYNARLQGEVSGHLCPVGAVCNRDYENRSTSVLKDNHFCPVRAYKARLRGEVSGHLCLVGNASFLRFFAEKLTYALF